ATSAAVLPGCAADEPVVAPAYRHRSVELRDDRTGHRVRPRREPDGCVVPFRESQRERQDRLVASSSTPKVISQIGGSSTPSHASVAVAGCARSATPSTRRRVRRAILPTYGASSRAGCRHDQPATGPTST